MTTPESRRHKRKRYFVHPHFQGWFIAKVAALLVATSTVSSVGVYLLTDDFVATTRRAAQIGALHWWGRFAPVLIGTNVATLIVGTVVAAYIVLYASHKVVGPLVRVRRVLEEIGDAKLHRDIRLREGDDIQETISAILRMEERIAERVVEVDDAVEALESEPSDEAIQRLRDAVQRLPRHADSRRPRTEAGRIAG